MGVIIGLLEKGSEKEIDSCKKNRKIKEEAGFTGKTTPDRFGTAYMSFFNNTEFRN